MKVIECPRDAIQGIEKFIPTQDKIRYINALLKVGFDTIDFGSFVSPKAIPQMRDTEQVLHGLAESPTHLLAIVANLRGAQTAAGFERIGFLGYPLSVSDIFQQRNTGKTIAESWPLVEEIQSLCLQTRKKLVVYLSMGFGNPYDEPFDTEVVYQASRRLYEMGIQIIAISDTIGCATPELIEEVFSAVIPALPQVEFGAHLHSNPYSALAKIEAAYRVGCRRFDGAIGGMGGCPMAKDELTGNIPTENILMLPGVSVDNEAFAAAVAIKKELFG